MHFEKAYSFLINKFEAALPAYLTYHNIPHTKAVIDAVEQLGKAENVTEHQQELLNAAALYHDAGFLKTYQQHEEASCEIARDDLPQFGYSAEDIEAICKLIMVTKVPQHPANHLEEILCDADLYYFGSDKYFETAEKLYEEFKHEGVVKNKADWRAMQINFLEGHRFFTATAVAACSTKKSANLEKIKQNNTTLLYKKERLFTGAGDLFYIILGVILAGFALKGFLVPNNFFDGGVTGISLLLHELYHFNLAYTIVLANLPLIAISYFGVSRNFAIKTFIAVLLLGVCLLLMPYPTITSDKLLVSIFGGFFLGVGIGLTMRAGCALDGVEVLALYTLKRSSFTITEIILGINCIIFIVAAFHFGLETSLYSALTYFTASQTINYVIEGIEAYTGVTIISGESEKVKHRLVNEMGRGITVYKGERGFLPGKFEVSADVDIIFTVITRLELRKLKNLVYDTDPKAFVFANTIKEASGGVVKRRKGH
jgi:uncharacterized membrane-anchored protein YitT (DUF2179 family)/predicted metal-dependent HD superfamily phosphohydrolase